MFDPFIGADGRYFFALLAAALSTIAFVPYLRGTIADRTSPQRSSWLIWSVLSSISLASQISEGAGLSLGFAGAQCGGTLVIFLLAIRRGAGSFLKDSDGVVLGLAALGLGLWYATDSALYALAISCGISLIGGTVTVAKAYRAPQTETMSFWLLSFFAAVFALASLDRFDLGLMLYPGYLLILNCAIVAAILFGRRQNARVPSQSAAFAHAR